MYGLLPKDAVLTAKVMRHYPTAPNGQQNVGVEVFLTGHDNAIMIMTSTPDYIKWILDSVAAAHGIGFEYEEKS